MFTNKIQVEVFGKSSLLDKEFVRIKELEMLQVPIPNDFMVVDGWSYRVESRIWYSPTSVSLYLLPTFIVR